MVGPGGQELFVSIKALHKGLCGCSVLAGFPEAYLEELANYSLNKEIQLWSMGSVYVEWIN